MPTNPHTDYLDRERNRRNEEISEALNAAAECLDEAISFGTHVLAWCTEAAGSHSTEVAPLVLSFRHCLEMLDAVSVLVRKGIVAPSDTNLRSAFESVLGMKYIIRGNLERRGKAYIVCHLHQRIKFLSRMDPETQMGKQFRAEIEGSPVKNVIGDKGNNLSQRRKKIESTLEDNYSIVEEEYQKIKDERNGRFEWYEMYNGPRSRKELADKVGMEGWYRILYNEWSRTSHARDVIGRALFESNQESYMESLRTPTRISPVAVSGITLCLIACRDMVEYLVPGKRETFEKWYVQEIRSKHTNIAENLNITLS